MLEQLDSQEQLEREAVEALVSNFKRNNEPLTPTSSQLKGFISPSAAFTITQNIHPFPFRLTQCKMDSKIVPKCSLQNAELWREFHREGNEMIITKNGRCLFPILKVLFADLSPNHSYTISMDFALTCPVKYRYRGNGKWKIQQKAADLENGDYFELLGQQYTHYEQKKSGKYFMEHAVSFAHMKITNRMIKAREDEGNGIFTLSSFHSYIPCIILEDLSDAKKWLFCFYETEFIAVTHYQNENVNNLKKSYNPHAKGFKDVLAGDK